MHYFGGCYVPGIFVTMQDKSRESYDVAFDLLIEAIKKLNPNWTPAEWSDMMWMTDFEEAMRSSIKARFPVNLLGCFFHFRYLFLFWIYDIHISFQLVTFIKRFFALWVI